jgi:hypothetical protein
MSKHKRLVLTILILIAALSLGTSSVAARATKTEVSGTYEIVSDTSPPMTNPDGNIHIRGWTLVSRVFFDDYPPIPTGRAVTVFDCNLDGAGDGPCQCSYRFEVGTWNDDTFTKGDGVWEGICTGEFVGLGAEAISLRIVAHGSEALEGTKYVFSIEEFGVWSGYIQDPHGE